MFIFQAVLFSLVAACAFTFVPLAGDTIYWNSSHRLTFADFRGRPAATSENSGRSQGEGRIAGAIIKSIVADTRKVKDKTWFIVYASMKPDLSWIAKKGDSTALRHEQGHFDLCEIYARKLRREIGNAESVGEAKKIWNRVLDQEETEQSLYDKANSYKAGGITAAWKNKIRKQLSDLDAWSSPEVPATRLR